MKIFWPNFNENNDKKNTNFLYLNSETKFFFTRSILM